MISAIVINYNGRHLLGDCLKSLLSQKYNNLEIILVDNGSQDDSIVYVKKNFPGVITLKLDNNTGFAGGCNAGIKIASGEYLLIINNDTCCDSGLVGELVNSMGLNNKIGMVAPKILNFYNRQEIDSIGVGIFFDGTSKGNKRLKIDNGSFDVAHEILCPSGCAAFYRVEMLDDIGLFDEDFFAYCEDTDLGLRAQLCGWKGYYNPKAMVYHKYSGTAKPFSDKKVYWVERNRIWVLLKNFPLFMIFLSPLFTFFRYVLNFFTAFTNKSPVNNYIKNYSLTMLFFTILKSYIDAFYSLPSIFEKRRMIKHKKKIKTVDFIKLLLQNKLDLMALVQ